MSRISTHVLDTARGRPGAGIPVVLERETEDGWVALGSGATDDDGRIGDLASPPLTAGVHRITFDTDAYFDKIGVDGFYPEAAVVFRVTDPEEHHHVPLLLSPFGYATYRGS